MKTGLVITAHPGDFVWRAGGAIALHAKKGFRMKIVCMAYGERGLVRIRLTSAFTVSGRKRVASPVALVVSASRRASRIAETSKVWVTVPLVILVLIGGLGGMFFAPNERKLGELARRDLAAGSELSAEYDDLFRRVAAAGFVTMALVLVAIFFMAAKPG